MKNEIRPDKADYDHGRPKHRGFTLNGEMHGTWEFYRRDGSMMRNGEFGEGKQVRIWQSYDRSGALVKETVFPPAST